MKARPLFYVTLALSLCLLTAADATHKVQALKAAPKGVSPQMAPLLDPAGTQVVGPKGTICEIWLLKNLAVKSKFKPSLNIKYPFNPGQFIGVMRVPEKTTYTDFRGQEIKAGVYTLRYGHQPEDGNHIGTSELYDFLLALPAKTDKDPKDFNFLDELHMLSAQSAGSTHPAIFSLMPAEKPAKAATLSHDDDHELWILNLTGNGKAKDKKVKVPVRMVVVGQSEA